jgi:hypothetical protein
MLLIIPTLFPHPKQIVTILIMKLMQIICNFYSGKVKML